ncbi:hypothetical protein MMC09_006907 [Bachmanniomyces sp. S44760]|nr:hypothetical protein [Bachmanniomyces sp. S44760]
MIAGLAFAFWRFWQIVTLIPTLGMLAYFVNIFQKANQLTPNYILVLFITSVLATVWALVTVLRRKSTRRSAIFVALVDLGFVGAFIAGVYLLRFIGSANCTTFTPGDVSVSIGTNGVSGDNTSSLNTNKTCAMLKACFAFGIMNTIMFFITFVLLLFMHRHENETVVRETTYRRRSHDSRRGHSRSGGGGGSRRHSSSRGGSRNYYV